MTDRQREFRNALGCFATGVAVATAAGPEGPVGVTINSFASVSLDPMLVLWSIDKASDRYRLFKSAAHFAICVLDDTGQDISSRLSRKGGGSIAEDVAKTGKGGVPILKHALAHFECAAEARHDAGDHVILVGRVLDFAYRSHGHPLIYYRGRYRALSSPEG